MPSTNAPHGEDGFEVATSLMVGGQLVYAIGDVHGRYDLLKALLAKVAQDYTRRAAGRTPVLVLCGDYVDRGPQSAEVLDALNWLTRRTDIELHLLKGNHEQAMLDFLWEPERGAGWLRFGGMETLVSYGVTPPPPDADAQRLARARDDLLDRLPAAHLLLLQKLEMMVTIGDFVFVHAGVAPGVALADQSEHDLLWIRQRFLEFNGAHEKVVVHGHTWTDARPQLLEHRLGLDTGAYSTGVLTALRFEDRSLAVMQARDEAGALTARSSRSSPDRPAVGS
jgi:serine/threonine protein phosphatase 1